MYDKKAQSTYQEQEIADLRTQWENGNRKYVKTYLSTLEPLKAAYVSSRMFSNLEWGERNTYMSYLEGSLDM